MTTLIVSYAPVASRRRPARPSDGWVGRLPGGILAALRVTLIYGEADRLSPPPA
jgi:hypothetical protein